MYKIAGINVAMNCAGKMLKSRALKYQVRECEKTDGTEMDFVPHISIKVEAQQLKGMKKKYSYLTLDECEYILTGFIFANSILKFDGFCLHSSAVAFEKRAVLFSGPCGVGKSTHARLWQQYFNENKVIIINDDKPVLRLINNDFYVYGTPWSGKDDLNVNTQAILGAIVFLKQAKENHIRRLSSNEAVQMMIYQSLRPIYDRDKMIKLMILLDNLIQKTPIYEMGCTISLDAVKMIYNEIGNTWHK